MKNADKKCVEVGCEIKKKIDIALLEFIETDPGLILAALTIVIMERIKERGSAGIALALIAKLAEQASEMTD